MNYPRVILKNTEETAEDQPIEISRDDIIIKKIGDIISFRSCGEFTNKAFYLSHKYDYKIGTDDEGQYILLVLKKGALG